MNTCITAWCAAALAATFVVRPAVADELRQTKLGDPIPEFSLPTLDGQRVGRAQLEGKPVILVFLSAQQRRSENAAASALTVYRQLPRDTVTLIYATADTTQAAWFRRLRATAGLQQPLLLDVNRKLYGSLGLIVLPTTIVIDADWRLAHVISSYKPDYEHVLTAYAEHTLGRLDDEALRQHLTTSSFERDRPEDRIARHRAAAEILRKSGLTAEAEQELRAALEVEAAHEGARLDLAALLISLNRLDEAAAVVDGVLAANPGQRRGRLLQGVVLYHAGKLDQAEAVLSETLMFNPDPVQNHYYLGLIYERQGDSARALEHYRQSLTRVLRDRPL